jgi:signal transduction histidine kinase
LPHFVAIALALSVIVWTEAYTWQRVDDLRRTADYVPTQHDITELHRMLTWSSIVLLGMGAMLAVFIYRGIIAPLRENLRRSQRIIERQEKLSSLGVLAAGIAHEIRNPLTSIRVRLFTQQALLKRGSEEFEDNVFLTDEIARLEQIVKDVLDFARPADPRLLAIKATQPMRELVPLLAPELKRSNLTLREDYLANPHVQADPGQLKQVLINLVKNAADAMGRDGVITLRTRTERRGLGPRASHHVAVLEVSDTGPGIAPDVARRLFDPFFTTKASGTGLGLSIAARILEKHGGTLEYSTELNRGTTFRIVLPIAHP